MDDESELSSEESDAGFPDGDLSSGDSIVFYPPALNRLGFPDPEISSYESETSSHGTVDLVSSDDSAVNARSSFCKSSNAGSSQIGARYILGSEGVEPYPKRKSSTTTQDGGFNISPSTSSFQRDETLQKSSCGGTSRGGITKFRKETASSSCRKATSKDGCNYHPTVKLRSREGGTPQRRSVGGTVESGDVSIHPIINSSKKKQHSLGDKNKNKGGLCSSSPVIIDSEGEEQLNPECSGHSDRVNNGSSSNPITLHSDEEEPQLQRDSVINKTNRRKRKSSSSSSSTTEPKYLSSSDEDLESNSSGRKIYHGEKRRRISSSSSSNERSKEGNDVDSDDPAHPGPSKIRKTGSHCRRRIVPVIVYTDESE